VLRLPEVANKVKVGSTLELSFTLGSMLPEGKLLGSNDGTELSWRVGTLDDSKLAFALGIRL